MELEDSDATLAAEVVAVVRSVLGHGLLGAYLHGSAVLGGLRPTSDLDILAVVDRSTTDLERRAVVKGLLEISGRRAYRGAARPVELTVAKASELRPWRAAPTVELLYGEWLRDELERGNVPEPSAMPDLGPEVALALAGNRALVGPPPAELLDPVPAADLRGSIVAGVPFLLGDLESDTRNVLLTFARIWATLVTGKITSKEDAAAWAIERLPAEHRRVLNRARALHLEGRDVEDWVDQMPAVRAHVGHVVAEIERAAQAGGDSRPRSDPTPAT